MAPGAAGRHRPPLPARLHRRALPGFVGNKVRFNIYVIGLLEASRTIQMVAPRRLTR